MNEWNTLLQKKIQEVWFNNELISQNKYSFIVPQNRDICLPRKPYDTLL